MLEIARIVRSMISSSSCQGRLPVMTAYLSASLPRVEGRTHTFVQRLQNYERKHPNRGVWRDVPVTRELAVYPSNPS
jgi:hypothetical protein